MIALDTNILVHAHRAASTAHADAVHAVETLASEGRPWGLPWPVVHEFVRVMTSHPKAPAPLVDTLQMVRRLVEAPGCTLLGESPDHLERVAALALAGDASGTIFYDARIAAICLDHGVTELWTTDRDFARFPSLKTRDPLTDPSRG